MSEIPLQVLDYLRQAAPFDVFDEDSLLDMAKQTKVVYLTADNLEEMVFQQEPALFLIRSGQYLVKEGKRAERYLSDSDFFGFTALLGSSDQHMRIDVDSPGIVYQFPQAVFDRCCDNKKFKKFFTAMQNDALQNQAVQESNSMWLYRSIPELLTRKPISIEQNVTIKDAAAVMAENGVSSIIITQAGEVVGIVTDRDLRNRVVALGVSGEAPVNTIMTSNPAHIPPSSTMFDAVAVMSERNIHHLPVIDPQSSRPVGMITTSDVIRQQKSNVLFMINELSKANNLYELTRTAWQMPQYFAANAKRVGDYDLAGKVLSQGTDVMTRKLLEFFEEQNGPAPMPYCWVVYGSQAREDQTMGSDQDNSLLLAYTPNAQEADYFAQMSDYVCQSLGKCGIKLCDGNIMASNSSLRQSIDQAIQTAQSWVQAPTPEAMLAFNIFLDARPVAGERSLFTRLQKARAEAFKNKLFLAALAREANSAAIPLSVFHRFVTKKHNGKKDCLDIKHDAVAVINNLARLYALSCGVLVPNTVQRLRDIPVHTNELTQQDADNLRDIWTFLNRLRWRHQLTNQVDDNMVSLSDLSAIEKHQLKAGLQAIHRAQESAVMKFSGGMG